MSTPDDENQILPTFFNLLNDEDKEKYMELRKTISNSDKRYKKNKRIESLQEALDMIQNYCIRNDSDDWKRFLVCGICWMRQDIAINTRQLRLLVDKCKSSINGALSKMGYSTAPIKSSITAALLTYIPFLKGNFVEQRQWTVRRRIQFSPLPPMRTNMNPSYNMYSYHTPEPGTPYIPWNYSPTNSDSTSPETPEEREIRLVFGVQNHNNSQNLSANPESNQVITNQNFMNNPQIPINNPLNMGINNNTIPINASFMNNGINQANTTEKNTEPEDETEDENEEDGPFSHFDDKGIADSEYNFLTDPCCCCPINWSIDGDDECFTMG